jgi:nucleoside-triphosphatase
MSQPPPRILITGKPGVGKTTIIQKVIERLQVPYGGFYTEEIREGGVRVGFRLRTMEGKEGIMAHVNSKSPHRVSKYGVEVSAFEDIAVPELDRVLQGYFPPGSRGEHKGSALLVIDELGRMELFSRKFQEKVLEIFDHPIPILAVIQDSRNPFLDRIRGRDDVMIYRVTVGNRDGLVGEIVKELESVRV